MYVLRMIFSFDFLIRLVMNFIFSLLEDVKQNRLGSRGQKCMIILSEDVEKVRGTQISIFWVSFLKYCY
jgi:hypothetical protein